MFFLCYYSGEQYWKDPERFINDQNEIVTPEDFILFGHGNGWSVFFNNLNLKQILNKNCFNCIV
jgi:hypothetical protein